MKNTNASAFPNFETRNQLKEETASPDKSLEMKKFQGLPVLLLVITFVGLTLFQGIQTESDICPGKCEGVGGATTEASAGGGEMCGEKDGTKITYKNKCWLECRGKLYGLQ